MALDFALRPMLVLLAGLFAWSSDDIEVADEEAEELSWLLIVVSDFLLFLLDVVGLVFTASDATLEFECTLNELLPELLFNSINKREKIVLERISNLVETKNKIK